MMSLCDMIRRGTQGMVGDTVNTADSGVSQLESGRTVTNVSLCDRVKEEVMQGGDKVSMLTGPTNHVRGVSHATSTAEQRRGASQGLAMSLCEKIKIGESTGSTSTTVAARLAEVTPVAVKVEGATGGTLCTVLGVKRPAIKLEPGTVPNDYQKRRCVSEEIASSADEGSSSDSLDPDQEAEVSSLLRESAPDGTLSQDDSHWRTWVAACNRVGVSPWRIKRRTSPRTRRKEKRKMAYVLWMIHKHQAPRSKKDKAAKPSSAYQVYLGARRVHTREGYTMVEGDCVVQAMKTMNKRFIKKYGYASMVTKRKEPLKRHMIEEFMALKEGTNLGCVKVKKTSRGYKSWRCMQAAAANSGFRKDEVTTKNQEAGLTQVQYTRASLVFVGADGTNNPDPDEKFLRAFDESCGVLLNYKPRPSKLKADQNGA